MTKRAAGVELQLGFTVNVVPAALPIVSLGETLHCH